MRCAPQSPRLNQSSRLTTPHHPLLRRVRAVFPVWCRSAAGLAPVCCLVFLHCIVWSSALLCAGTRALCSLVCGRLGLRGRVGVRAVGARRGVWCLVSGVWCLVSGVFQDGSEIPVDEVIACTGYALSFPFLPQGLQVSRPPVVSGVWCLQVSRPADELSGGGLSHCTAMGLSHCTVGLPHCTMGLSHCTMGLSHCTTALLWDSLTALWDSLTALLHYCCTSLTTCR